MNFGVPVGGTITIPNISPCHESNNLSSKDLISTRYESTDASRDCPERVSRLRNTQV